MEEVQDNNGLSGYLDLIFLLKGQTLASALRACNARYGKNYNYENIRAKLKRNTITFTEVEQLCNTLGIIIQFYDKHTKQVL